MTRLLIHVEGETEESFVNEVLASELRRHGFLSVNARLMGSAPQRSRRGGIKPWDAVREDIVRHLKKDQGCLATTMVDYYGIPRTGPRAWPGREEASSLASSHHAESIEKAIADDIGSRMGSGFDRNRFIPYVMLHEFEALLFSDCSKFARGIDRPDLAPKFQEIRDDFATPEAIDDSPETAPSKRIEALVPEYEKPLFGTVAALEIGLPAMRDACPHFNDWLNRLTNAVR